MPDLTPRQLDVLRLVAEGYSNKRIGAALGIAEKTARNYVSGLIQAAGLESRTQLAIWTRRMRDASE